jgi:histidinol-phosphate aminotransferase
MDLPASGMLRVNPLSAHLPYLPAILNLSRVGMAIAHPAIIDVFSKVQMPYKLSSVVLELAERALSKRGQAHALALQRQIMTDRDSLVKMLADPTLARNRIGAAIGGQAANFVLLPILTQGERDDVLARRLTEQLRERHAISIRYVGRQAECEGCVRITVGTADELNALRKALNSVLSELD